MGHIFQLILFIFSTKLVIGVSQNSKFYNKQFKNRLNQFVADFVL